VLVQDIRYALRSFLRAPGFTLVALLTLALGIGGTTAIFSIVDGVLLRPLPYSDPGRILRINRVGATGGLDSFSAADYRDLKKDATSFSAIAGYRSDIVDMTGRSEPIRIIGMQTTAAFFDALDAAAAARRTYHEATDKPGAAVAVISETTWRQQFGANPAVIGTQVRLNGAPAEIIGVVPEFLRHPQKSDVWMLSPFDVPTSPFGVDGNDSRDIHYFSVVGRIARDRQLVEGQQQLKSIGDQIARDHQDNAGSTFRGEPLASSMVADVRTAMLVLLGAVGFVLLIACANVAGLLIARGAARRRELAVRTALGAGRGRLIQQLLTESLVLALAGGALGMLVATWTQQLLINLAPENLPRLADIALDWRIAAFAFVATIVVGALFGLTPALQSSRPELNADLKDGGRGGTSRTGLRNVMVVAQVALALVLLIGAGLMLTSFARLRSVDPGFRVTEVVTVELMLPLARFDDTAQRNFYMACTSGCGPIRSPHSRRCSSRFRLAAATRKRVSRSLASPRSRANSAPARISIRCRRDTCRPSASGFSKAATSTTATVPKSTPVVLISESAVKDFGGKDPIGEKVDMGDAFTVIGIVSDARRRSLDTPPRAAVYLPYTQFVLPYMGAVVRTDRGAGAVASAVKERRRADRSRPADRRRQDHGADHRGVDRRAPLPIIPDRQLRGPGAAAGRGRRLWIDQLSPSRSACPRSACASRSVPARDRYFRRSSGRVCGWPSSASCSAWWRPPSRRRWCEGCSSIPARPIPWSTAHCRCCCWRWPDWHVMFRLGAPCASTR
jgi:predicted permease